MKWIPADCLPGDMIRVRLGSVYHYGVFVSEDEVIAFGLPPVEKYKNDERRALVCATDIDVFSCGEIVERAVLDRAERSRRRAPEKTVEIARSRVGEDGYNLLHNNCEHFANECVFGVRRSEQEEDARRRWLSRPICDVYVAAIPEGDVPDLPAIHPPERAKEIAACKNADLRRAKYWDWRLLALAAERSLGVGIAEAHFRKKLGGKWVCDKFDFSLTHTKSAVAVAVSNAAVGVDMEFVGEIAERFDGERIAAMKKRYFTESELAYCGEGAAGFAACFTKKEAVFKRRGRGVFAPSKIDGADEGARTVFTESGAVISVCGENVGALRVYETDFDSVSLAKLGRESVE